MNNDLQFIPPPTLEEIDDAKRKRKIERLIIVAAFVLALFSRISWSIVYNDDADYWLPLSGLFWILFSSLYFIINYSSLRNNKNACIVFLIGIIVACSQLILFFPFDAPNDNIDIYGLNFYVLPLIFTVGVQLIRFQPTDPSEQQNLLLNCLIVFFTMPFSAIHRIVSPFREAFAKKKDGHGVAFRIAIGLICSIPFVLLALYFLSRADERFALVVTKIFESLDIRNIILTVCFLTSATIFAYSYLWNARFNHDVKLLKPSNKQLNSITVGTILCALLAVYLLFFLVQLSYLFPSAGLPNDLSYASYARRGFVELIIVCIINISIYFAVLTFVADQKFTRILLMILLAFTLFMAISSLTRLSMYIVEYDAFTFLRTLSMWFILYVLFVIVTCAINLFRRHKSLQEFLVFVLLGWYCTFSLAYVPFMSLFGA